MYTKKTGPPVQAKSCCGPPHETAMSCSGWKTTGSQHETAMSCSGWKTSGSRLFTGSKVDHKVESCCDDAMQVFDCSATQLGAGFEIDSGITNCVSATQTHASCEPLEACVP